MLLFMVCTIHGGGRSHEHEVSNHIPGIFVTPTYTIYGVLLHSCSASDKPQYVHTMNT